MSPTQGKNEDDNDDDAEMPEEFSALTPEEQQWAVSWKAVWLLTLGTIVVVIFSDPMVDVLSELGARSGIPSFYVSFTLAPIASNASEVIASYNYALKKTAKSIAISLSSLQGACCMNSTFVLGIFLICVYTQQLAWHFFAETVSIMFSIMLIALMSLKKTHNMLDASIILMIYPLALVIVYCLEANGFD
jgi:calcium/proton exchanger cax